MCWPAWLQELYNKLAVGMPALRPVKPSEPAAQEGSGGSSRKGRKGGPKEVAKGGGSGGKQGASEGSYMLDQARLQQLFEAAGGSQVGKQRGAWLWYLFVCTSASVRKKWKERLTFWASFKRSQAASPVPRGMEGLVGQRCV